MKRATAIIVDDEYHARNVVEKFVEASNKNLDIIGTFSNLLDAVQFINENDVDIVFLDIQMPKQRGLEIVNYFDNFSFSIIFITAYEKYAIKAFEISAIDYIVKPVRRDRLYKAIDRALEENKKRISIEKYKILLHNFRSKKKKIVISETSSNRVIDLDTVLCFQGQGSYSKLYLSDGSNIIVSKNLKHVLSLLPEEHSFFRSQRSWVINLQYVTKFNTNKNVITLNNQIETRLSKNKVLEFKIALETNSTN